MTQKVFTLTVFALVLNAVSARQFLITSKRQVATIKTSAVFVISVHNAIKLSRFATNWLYNWFVKFYVTCLCGCEKNSNTL